MPLLYSLFGLSYRSVWSLWDSKKFHGVLDSVHFFTVFQVFFQWPFPPLRLYICNILCPSAPLFNRVHQNIAAWMKGILSFYYFSSPPIRGFYFSLNPIHNSTHISNDRNCPGIGINCFDGISTPSLDFKIFTLLMYSFLILFLTSACFMLSAWRTTSSLQWSSSSRFLMLFQHGNLSPSVFTIFSFWWWRWHICPF